MATLPERLAGESAEDYHARLQQLKQHEKIGGEPVVDDTEPEDSQAEHLHLVDVDPLLLRQKDEEPEKSKGQRIVEDCLASGEPFFVVRGKDILSRMVIAHYLNLLDQFLPEEHQMSEGVVDVRDAIINWQRQHPAELRYPD